MKNRLLSAFLIIISSLSFNMIMAQDSERPVECAVSGTEYLAESAEAEIKTALTEYLTTLDDYFATPVDASDEPNRLNLAVERTIELVSPNWLQYEAIIWNNTLEDINQANQESYRQLREQGMRFGYCNINEIHMLGDTSAIVMGEIALNGTTETIKVTVFTFHKDNGIWHISPNSISNNCTFIDFMPLDTVEILEHQGVTLEPLGLIHCYEEGAEQYRMDLAFLLNNQSGKGILWGWANKTIVAFQALTGSPTLPGSSHGQVFLPNPAGQPYNWTIFLRGWYEFPTSGTIRIQSLEFCHTPSCSIPEGFSEWEFVFEIPSPSTSIQNDDPSLTTPSGDTTLTITASEVINVRDCPNTDCAKVGEASPRQIFSLLSQNEDGTWYEIQFSENQTGWVRADLAKPTDDMPIVETGTNTQNDVTCTLTTIGPSVPFFVNADALSDTLGQLTMNSSYTATRRRNAALGGTFYQIEVNGTRGWVPGFFVNISGQECSSLPN